MYCEKDMLGGDVNGWEYKPESDEFKTVTSCEIKHMGMM